MTLLARPEADTQPHPEHNPGFTTLYDLANSRFEQAARHPNGSVIEEKFNLSAQSNTQILRLSQAQNADLKIIMTRDTSMPRVMTVQVEKPEAYSSSQISPQTNIKVSHTFLLSHDEEDGIFRVYRARINSYAKDNALVESELMPDDSDPNYLKLATPLQQWSLMRKIATATLPPVQYSVPKAA